MERALQLARLGEGRTSPNPMVGALVLDAGGVLVGEGFHAAAGRPHAEVGALRQAGEAARGGTLVVTLEPCAHHGRTPPCCDAVIAAGIQRVVMALEDPDPRVAGGGRRRLEAAGVTVISGVLEDRAAELNRAFLRRVRTGLPWGILKWASSVDGRIALPNGSSQWISSSASRRRVHALRAGCDAVIVGGGTLRRDDPLLTSRGRRDPEPLRVVLSRRLELPAAARLWQVETAPTLVVHGPLPEASRPLAAQLSRAGVQRLELAEPGPRALMEELARGGCNRVLWECGPGLAAQVLREGCAQEIRAVLAPRLMGGTTAATPLADLGHTAMDEVPLAEEISLHRSDVDLIWTLRL
ncbi:bifunctional diaminohydroxyphosphoribosylaminopyrimidine deaminase/5-amino-6-(5-phosphoribosylamino)uracil reductase RibD [Synechococcus sp. RSCCF101]|uniref:bifunctional diaminohydroxyphosphoribosylaminopyrimidine deaminase/5-amino-6-(5-phosphoribosylamino)uracil reductase RibD n=1 Tax=Synechococcus sp. RSCCF101 TaxID=2511069 RepID=UPI001243D7A6|nr:bifunctional diaminohydroxyphosphoribosylaminopyrimidine deaminase/5-amino-6-(5-phosphoribosylamino)uracil reductase RibD [Synechococcus sp. RSCCF101]QEY33418.1 bifunctional diaminohydroxyphosphoribosylaminopyrimidine deaminase/5-amino-6-(5-phosphoribosylamino)uracil reductase RibD [Synechococcus sp. RSCCF101]